MAGPGSIVRTVAWFALFLTSWALSTCERIATTSDIKIESPLEPGYIFDQTQYWSSACGQLTPTCHLVPSTANEVSTIIKALNENNETFAIKSGGHNPNRGFSSVEGGPLINMKGLSEVTYLPASGTVRVGPGNRWTDVVKYLEPLGVTVVGGRIGHVGVGGYLLGQGLSYLSSQHGWAVNTVVEFEVVLANGTITSASAKRNPDLFNALRGGGNNFGVVTTYIMRAYPIGKVWGGNLIFSGDKTDAILLAIRNFTESYTDEKAAVIATSDITVINLVNVWVIFLFYDGEVVPPGTFDVFFNVGIPVANTFAPTSYSFFLSSTDSLVINGQVHEFATETTPVPSARYGLEVMKSYHSHFVNVAKSMALVPGMTASLAYQPLPKRLARKARQSGGDVLDLDDSVDRLSFCYILMYNLPALPVVDNSIKTLGEGVRDRREGFVRSGKLPNAYSPLFMNDGNNQQNFFSRIRPAKLKTLKAARDKYDPKGFFRYRTGGFKLE